MTKHVLLRYLRTWTERKNGLDRVAQDGVRHSDYCYLRYTFQCIDHVFHFSGTNFFTASLNNVVLPADEIQVSLFVCAKEITTVKNFFSRQRTGLEASG